MKQAIKRDPKKIGKEAAGANAVISVLSNI